VTGADLRELLLDKTDQEKIMFLWCARRSWRVPAGESPVRVRP
jgi:hypothetical protein